MKVLFIGSELFFGTSVGGFRQDRWMKAFLENGNTCTVVDYASLVPRYFTTASWTEYAAFRTEIKNAVPKKSSVRQGVIASVLRRLKHFFIVEVFHPLVWVKIFIIYRKLRQEQFDLVFASTPPFTSCIIALSLLKLGVAKKQVIDFRDEWADSLYLPKGSFISKKIIERQVVRNSAHCITVSDYSKKNLQKLYAYSNITLIYNAPDISYSKEQYATAPNASEQLRIVYTGSFPDNTYNYPALYKLINNCGTFFGEKMEFVFAGSTLALQKVGPLGNARFLEQLPVVESRKMQQGADCLLFVAADFPDNGGIVSSKIFEYIQSERPILPLFVYEGSDVFHIISRACGSCPIIHTWEQLHALLNGMKSENTVSMLPSLKNKEFFHELLDAYPNFIKQVNHG
jgi:hypothetical protein